MIGILDSGVGGLSVLREVHSLLPHQSVIYLGDQACCPYGNKNPTEIISRTFALSDFLIAQGVELIVLACNSATIVAIEALRNYYSIPFIGMEPGIKPAAQITKSGTIGVLATEASLSGHKFHRLVATHARDIRVITQSCPKFVELVERGLLSGPQVEHAIDEYTSPMLAAGADTLILGCSHYPFLIPALEKSLSSEITIIDTGAAIARQIAKQQLPPEKKPKHHIFTTGNPHQFSKTLSQLTPELQTPCQPLLLP